MDLRNASVLVSKQPARAVVKNKQPFERVKPNNPRLVEEYRRLLGENVTMAKEIDFLRSEVLRLTSVYNKTLSMTTKILDDNGYFDELK